MNIYILVLYLCLHVVYSTQEYKQGELISVSLDIVNFNKEYVERLTTLSPILTFTYQIKSDLDEKYKIGNVLDGTLLVYPDLESLHYREVTVTCDHSGDKYVVIYSIYEVGDDDFSAEVIELKRESGRDIYIDVVRKPINIELSNVDSNEFIDIEAVNNTKQITILNHLAFKYVIGSVKFKNIPIDENIERVISKIVTTNQISRDKIEITVDVTFNDSKLITKTLCKYDDDSKECDLIEIINDN